MKLSNPLREHINPIRLLPSILGEHVSHSRITVFDECDFGFVSGDLVDVGAAFW
jgi:hypothetical protein